ncbi:MAG: winged helix-turn-helix domain-containing protein [Methanocalculus sp.]|uniref:winged helix-turn-helix domain-containing protein n=1 Tax=Methanocalculus sp. TaxID=2004547 RepID=UPI00271E3B8F|nr:winged helix-turn-helix domain-containing protein [Methanocalculus sp.]MDO9539954.1 winged helix-turn-helix domain-containing protein [Methanocalculus sp.]
MYKILESGRQMTQKELVMETSLSSRTVRYALRRLKDEGIIIERHSFIDARQSFYALEGAVGRATTA